ncbi:hypothetical protein BDN70DRAFT_761574, partial [Pholiota conissans]
CGRNFAQLNAYSNHVNSCRPQKKRMASALETAKETYRLRKKARLHTTAAASEPHINQLHEPQSGPTAESSSTSNSIEDESHCLAVRRPRRLNRQLPLRYRQDQPMPPSSLPPSILPQQKEAISKASSSDLHTIQPVRQLLESRCNTFGLFRQYHGIAFPTHDPDADVERADLSEVVSDHPGEAITVSDSLFRPYPNQSAFLLGEWYWNGGIQKTKEDFKKLTNIICADTFDPLDIQDVPWDSLNRRLGESSDSSEDVWCNEPDAGWIESPITISIPFPNNSSNPGLRSYTFPPFLHRSIVSVLKEKMANSHDFQHFHLEPYELRWRRGLEGESTRVHGELYTSPAFLEEHNKIQESAGEPGCSLPRVLIGLLFGSDETHLTDFGSASLHPCYMYFGNESKYRRCKPTCNLCNHVGYFHKLPTQFRDFATLHAGVKGPTEKFMAHCEREYLHAQWKELFDDDFLDAYEHGVIIECCDGLKRRFYLRIFACCADYPEKVKLCGIRNMGDSPCPRCLVSKRKLDLVGMEDDNEQRSSQARVDTVLHRKKIKDARKYIYGGARVVVNNTTSVEPLLKPESLVPAQNAFSDKLSHFGFNLFSVFLVDFMHEIELGVWKNLFLHLLRILDCIKNAAATYTMDQRFREVPSFGRDSIRRFANRVSKLQKLGARDYENLLQCSIPVFDELLPNKAHNNFLLELLFTFAHWHALAKLRQHTDLSLTILESTTIELGHSLREFEKNVCPFYATQESSQEASTRERQTAKKLAGSKSAGASTASNPTSTNKTFSLNTYKFHSLGDYVETIRRNGTTDSFSTEQMELEHRSPKSHYRRTSRKMFEKQLSQIERRQTRIRRIRQRLNNSGKMRFTLSLEKGPESSACAYHIGKTQNHPVDLGSLAPKPLVNLNFQDFVKKLKEHLLPRILSRFQIPTTSNDSVQVAENSLLIKDNRIYNHKLARFYHTTYDVRRSEDVVNPRTSHCDIMLLADVKSDDNTPNTQSMHPFLYARVVGIYHVNVVYVGPGHDITGYEAMRFDFLHVRWFRLDSHSGLGWSSKRLDSLSFPPILDHDAFDFVDPSLVLRGCHLIPKFSLGRCHPDKVGLSNMARDARDWKSYYVNRFADRDMVMRYHWGLGIGHTYS